MDSEEKAEIAQREAEIAQREEEEKEKQAQREAAEKEKARLANLNNTGMWQVSYFVDDFGEPTKDGYITNKQFIKGSFSNTATEDSKLNVRLLTLSETNIHIMLYEYAGNNPVKASSRVTYTLLVQDKDGNRLELKAGHRSDRLILQVEASSGVHQALMKGGEVRFRIIENGNRTNQYSFDISDADRYDNAYRIMSER